MFTLAVKGDASDINVPAARSLLLLAVIVTGLYRNENVFAINIAVMALLLVANLFTATILVKYRINSLLFHGIAALLVAIATKDVVFPLLLIATAFIINRAYVKPQVQVQENGISIKKSFSRKTFGWHHFNNVVLKDNLLTLDFINNKMLQLELENNTTVNEQEFNAFCAGKISR